MANQYSEAASGTEPFWSELMPEILDQILQKLPLPDCFTFAKVCKSWRSVYFMRRCLSHPPPCIMMPGSGGKFSTQRFWSLHGSQLLKIRSPKPLFREPEFFVGSSVGWLALGWFNGNSLQLLHPTSNARIHLPEMAKSEMRWGHFFVHHADLSSSPTSSDCIIIVTGPRWGHGQCLAWCRLNDPEWTIFNEQLLPLGFEVTETIFLKGELYILGLEGVILVYTFDPQPNITDKISITGIIRKDSVNQRLVESDGELLLVSWCKDDMIDIFKKEKGRYGRWVRVKSLGDWALLIGHHTVESFICTEYLMGSGFEANCIYFHSSNWKSTSLGELVKYSMADGSSSRISLPAPYLENFEWVMIQEW